MAVYCIMYPCRLSVVEQHGDDGFYRDEVGLID